MNRGKMNRGKENGMSGSDWEGAAPSWHEAYGEKVRKKTYRRGGRPRKPPEDRRTYRYTVKVNEREKEAIESRATQTGLKVSVYLREAGVGARLHVRHANRTYHRLSRIGLRLRHAVEMLASETPASEVFTVPEDARSISGEESALSRKESVPSSERSVPDCSARMKAELEAVLEEVLDLRREY